MDVEVRYFQGIDQMSAREYLAAWYNIHSERVQLQRSTLEHNVKLHINNYGGVVGQFTLEDIAHLAGTVAYHTLRSSDHASPHVIKIALELWSSLSTALLVEDRQDVFLMIFDLILQCLDSLHANSGALSQTSQWILLEILCLILHGLLPQTYLHQVRLSVERFNTPANSCMNALMVTKIMALLETPDTPVCNSILDAETKVGNVYENSRLMQLESEDEVRPGMFIAAEYEHAVAILHAPNRAIQVIHSPKDQFEIRARKFKLTLHLHGIDDKFRLPTLVWVECMRWWPTYVNFPD